MIFEQCYGVDFSLRAGVVKEVGHELVAIVGLAKVGSEGSVRCGAISIAVIAMRAHACLGPLPISHYLSHGISDAAHLHMAVVAFSVGRTLVVIKLSLMPDGATQRSDGAVAAT